MRGDLMTSSSKTFLPLLFVTLIAASDIRAQVFKFSRDQMVKYTAQNPFERFTDGRPKVPDALLEKLKEMSAEEVLGLNQRGYRNQWESGWEDLIPHQKNGGRAET